MSRVSAKNLVCTDTQVQYLKHGCSQALQCKDPIIIKDLMSCLKQLPNVLPIIEPAAKIIKDEGECNEQHM